MTADPITSTTTVPDERVVTTHRGPVDEREGAGPLPATVPSSVSLPIGVVLWLSFRDGGCRDGRNGPSFVGRRAGRELRWA